jgi:PEP-CTERM motif
MSKLRHAMQCGTCARVTALLTSLLAVALVLAVPARADVVTFNDLTDTLTATVTSGASGSQVTINECGIFTIELKPRSPVSVEGCRATFVGPAGSTSFTAPLLTLIGGDNGNVSDAILVLSDFSDKNELEVIFASDIDIPGKSGIGVACNTFPTGCQVTETGGVQPGITITWSNGAKDTVSFQSDAESIVPEPSSLMLLGGGLLVVAGYLKKRLA